MNQPAKIGVIHTSPATVDLFGRLLREKVPGAIVINMLDDSILPELRDNGGELGAVEPRWQGYVRTISDRGVDLILNACSSIGGLCERARALVPQPVVRVDALMAEVAVRRGTHIGILATLQTTLGPTGALVEETALKQGRSVVLDPVLVEGAYPALMRGDQQLHDDLIAATLDRSARRNDVVILAQASMARVLPRLDADLRTKVLTSPAFAVADVLRHLDRTCKIS
jgi:Asp/Glu/hydantoin racemase